MKQRIAFALIMSMITTAIVSFTLISVTRGYANGLILVWLKSWAIAYLVAIPAILLIAPKIHNFVNGLWKEEKLTTKE